MVQSLNRKGGNGYFVSKKVSRSVVNHGEGFLENKMVVRQDSLSYTEWFRASYFALMIGKEIEYYSGFIIVKTASSNCQKNEINISNLEDSPLVGLVIELQSF